MVPLRSDNRRVIDGRRKCFCVCVCFHLVVCISLVVVHALVHGRHLNIVAVSMDAPQTPVGTSLMHRPLVWMYSLVGPPDTPNHLLPVAETPTTSYCLLVLFQQGIIFGRSPSRQFKHGFLAPRTLIILILPNHWRAVCPNSNNPFLNVQTRADPASFSPLDFLSKNYLCSFVPTNSWRYI